MSDNFCNAQPCIYEDRRRVYESAWSEQVDRISTALSDPADQHVEKLEGERDESDKYQQPRQKVGHPARSRELNRTSDTPRASAKAPRRGNTSSVLPVTASTAPGGSST